MTITPSFPSGILNVDKPLGWTSHDIVGLVRRLTGVRRVGHAGTLDPLATGVLLVTIGQATRLSDYLMHGRKLYHARLHLGVRTSTDDAEGEPIALRPTAGITREDVAGALSQFRGEIEQIPPAYAAIKRGGVPAYKLARRGAAPRMEPRRVRIDALALLGMDGDLCDVLVWCSAGTYIRALARDVGERLDCGAHLAALRRLTSGDFSVDTAVGVEELRQRASAGTLRACVRPMDEAVAGWPALVVDDATADRVLHGMAVQAPEGALAVVNGTAGMTRIYARDGRLLALARYDDEGRRWRPATVFGGSEETAPVPAPLGGHT